MDWLLVLRLRFVLPHQLCVIGWINSRVPTLYIDVGRADYVD
jgi:hypothetical protein